ncbi:choice-of-anchor D domain-containing protein [Haliangium ochraceum]|uniref:Alkyl hydroperoxide reductase/ Thiol specific antioxidant/ Mal allergen n=1 Tax=Haliangium ochraceum (strain DSM 14365 / JCM 11303 / SMP-2) TaxID=502025 RepID=D0LMQ1_HALO1|nr:choice-of-anchor D domain-containing protein [Haliangium ochraceum]ACY18738.1 alkyl hydroperoxide reductase/ Thiol specific antioxidant/ Mal allergen [Haliangium ochraceum DSM 14365]
MFSYVPYTIRSLSRVALPATIGLFALASGCANDSASSRLCGAGTVEQNGICVPAEPMGCGEGTVAVNGVCVPSSLEPGHFQNPLVQMQVLHGVGSHTDEIRLRDDGLLLNCSYTFNVIDATDANDLDLLSPSEGLRHDVPGSERAPGCKHLAWDEDLVFTTHLGTIRNPAFLSGWDISDPEQPVQLALMQEPGISYEGVDVANHHIFVGLHENGLGVYTYDADEGFARVGGLGGFTNAWGVAARGDHVFVADGVGGLVTVDASDPGQPVELGRVVTGGQARYVVVDGDIAYVAAGSAGVAVVDISDLTKPTIITHIEMPGTALRLDVSENRVFVAAWNDVRVYDLSEPASPRFIAAVRIPRPFEYDDADRELPTMRIFGVAARGRDVFIGTWENPYSYRLEPERLAPNIRLPETSARVDFGPVAVGDKKTLAFEVTNQGTAPLTLVDTWIAGASFAVSPRRARIQPGESLQLTLSYTASTTDEELGYLNIVSDDPAAPVRVAYLVGNASGLSVGAPLPETAGTMLDGTSWSSSESEGYVLLLSYFATFCPVCANHLPDVQERIWQPYRDQGLHVVALNPRETTEQIDQVQVYADNIRVGFPLGIEDATSTYQAVTSNFPGPNPFPVDVIVDKSGIVRYVSHEYDPEAMLTMIEQLLAE